VAAPFIDYYRILGTDPTANQQTIRSAYRRLARQYHPDVARSKSADKQFLLVREAYEVLCDPEKRRQYDRIRSALPLRSEPSGLRSAPRRGEARGVASARVRRGFRIVLDALGIRLDAGVGFGKPVRRTQSRSRRRGKTARS
jgi:curved DNA-binding protein